MKTTCPHCSNLLEIDAEALDSLHGQESFACPACSGAVPMPSLAELRAVAPLKTVITSENTEESSPPDTPTTASHAPWRGMNHNFLVLGSAALLVLGVLVFIIATRDGTNKEIIEKKIIQKGELNEYFRQLIDKGTATEKDLEQVAGIESFGGSLIGITRDSLTFAEADALAGRVGAEILDLARVGPAREEIASWLGRTYPDTLGKTTWIRDKGETMGFDSPDFGPVTTHDRPRRAFLYWQGNMPTGWTWSIEPRFDEVMPFDACGLARVRMGTHWGLIDRTGKNVLTPVYDAISAFSEHNCARLSLGDKTGLVDHTGKILAKAEWQDVQDQIHGFVPVKSDGKWGYLDANLQLVIPCEWDDAWRFSVEGFAVVTRAGKRGIIDRGGKLIVQPEWDGAINFCKEGVGALRRGKHWALVRADGNILTEPIWQLRWADRRFDLGFIPVRSPAGLGCSLLGIDGKVLPGRGKDFVSIKAGVLMTRDGQENVLHGAGGKEILRFQGSARKAGEGYLRIENGDQFGFLDENGSWAITMRPGRARDVLNGMVAVSTKGKWGFLDATGKPAVPEVWDDVSCFSEDRAAVMRGNQWGFVDRAGQVIAEPRWEMVGDFSCGLAAVSEGMAVPTGVNPEFITLAQKYRRGGRQAMDLVRSLPRDQVNEFWAAYRYVNKSRRWAFIDTNGTIALDLGDSANSFYQEPKFTENRLYVPALGYINPQGKPCGPVSDAPDGTSVITTERPGNYHDRHGHAGETHALQNAFGMHVMAGINPKADFSSDFIPHATPPKYGLMDTKGKVLVPPTWDVVRVLSPEWVWIGQGGKCGIADSSGRVVLEPLWNEVRAISADWLWFRKGYQCGLADATGRIVVKPEWDEVKVLDVRTASLAEDGKQLVMGPGGKKLLSSWIRVKGRNGHQILTAEGKPAITPKIGDAQYVDFYGSKHIVLMGTGPDGNALWSLYEPYTDTKSDFPDANRMFWNWSMSLSGLLWIESKADSSWKLMDATGKDLGHSQVEKPDEWEIREGMGLLQDAKGWFFVNGKGQRLGTETWTNARPPSEGRVAVERDGKWGFINKEGMVIAEPVWVEVRDFKLGLAAVKGENGWWGFIDLDGKVAIPPVWDEVGAFSRIGYDPTGKVRRQERDVVPTRLKGLWGCIDRTGRLLVVPKHFEPTAEFVPLFNEHGLVADKWSKQVTNWILNEGGAPVMWGTRPFTGVKWRSVDGSGKPISYFGPNQRWQYDDGSPVLVNNAPVTTWSQSEGLFRNKLPFVDGFSVAKSGNWFDPYYNKGWPDIFSGGLIPARTSEQKYGLLRLDGVQVVHPVYDRIAWVAPGIAAAWSRIDGGLLDRGGKWIFRDNDQFRIARFGARNARSTDAQYRHGLVVIEDSPKWGFARLKR
jgi:hypothetical protein